ncbi:hypothetical protein BDV93DRAFT_514893 [Ceratobasidium sp. AG-I]|nr:hypothetical protein BDV93DRAFT_514893 [Ceratobasidium sp. AG-I]
MASRAPHRAGGKTPRQSRELLRFQGDKRRIPPAMSQLRHPAPPRLPLSLGFPPLRLLLLLPFGAHCHWNGAEMKDDDEGHCWQGSSEAAPSPPPAHAGANSSRAGARYASFFKHQYITNGPYLVEEGAIARRSSQMLARLSYGADRMDG